MVKERQLCLKTVEMVECVGSFCAFPQAEYNHFQGNH